MTADVKPAPRLTPSGSRLVVLIVAASAASALLVAPRPIVPRELPGVRVTRAELGEAQRADASLAAELPQSDEVAALRRALGRLRQGADGASEVEEESARAERDRALQPFRGQMELLDQVRAAEMTRFDELVPLAALRSTAALEALPREVMGGFAARLRHRGAALGDTIVAPPLSVRAAYEAEVNRLLLRPEGEGLDDAERRAFYGWIALHAGRTPVAERLRALAIYTEAGGRGGAEARAYFAFYGGEFPAATLSYRAAYEASGALRLRNHGLAAAALF